MPEPFRLNVSAEMLALPEPPRRPPLPSELRQPSPEPTTELLPQGQAVPLPSPGQNEVMVWTPRICTACGSVGQQCSNCTAQMSTCLPDGTGGGVCKPSTGCNAQNCAAG